ncbi:hypothetical protein JE939_002902 [Yersinia ruckeri]|nr:hypothetical protein [Yersinia ruckeri]
MEQPQSPLFSIEAFIRSEGVSADILILDAIIIEFDLSESEKSQKISALIDIIKARNV